MNNKKLLLYLICTEAMLILCIALANLRACTNRLKPFQ